MQAKSNQFQSLIFRFLIYRVVSRFSFYVPIFVVALLASNFSYFEVGGILFIYGVATMTFGGFAQRFMQKYGPALTITLGEVLKCVGNILIGFVLLAMPIVGDAGSVTLLAFAQLLGGIGYSFAAVGDGSYLSKAAVAVGASEDAQTQAQARSSSYMFISFLAAGIVGAVVFQVSPALPFFMTTVANAAAAVIARRFLILQTDSKSKGPQKAQESRAKLTLNAQINLFTYAFLRAVVLTLQLLILPVWFFIDLKIEVSFFGLLFGLYTLSGFLGGRFYPLISQRLSHERTVGLVMFSTLSTMLALSLGQLTWITLAAPLGMFCAAGMLRPALLPALNRATTKSGSKVNTIARAEQLFGALSALAYLICSITFGFGHGPQQVVLAATALVALALVLRFFVNLKGERNTLPEIKAQ